MHELTARGVRFNVLSMGDGRRPIVCVHGMVLDNLACWYLTIAPTLTPLSSLFLYDLRGHGHSEQPPTGYTMDDQLLDLAGLMDSGGIDRPVTLIGKSFGGLVALTFASRFPERVESLVLLEPPAGEDGFGNRMQDFFAAIGDPRRDEIREIFLTWYDNEAARGRLGIDALVTVKNVERLRKRRQRTPMADKAWRLVTDTSFIDDLIPTPPLSDADLQRVACPVLALYGGDSDVRPDGERLAAVLPDCTLEIVPGCEHGVLWQGTDRLREVLVEWVGDGTP
jgi:pimeloyl-ACP methyl ester carboxylesterase